jgi:hypothetical protein
MTAAISTGSITLIMLSSCREGLSKYAYFTYLNQDPVFYSQNTVTFKDGNLVRDYFYVKVLQDVIT